MSSHFIRDDRPFFNIIPSIVITTNTATLSFIALGALFVLVTKGFHFKAKKTATTEYMKQRQMTFRLGKDPNSVPKPKFTDNIELEKEDKNIIYNRLHDPSQFVFEGYGFKRPLTIILYIYRVCLALYMVLMMTIDVSYFRPKPFLKYFSFLTNTSAFIFALYYVFQSVFGLFYITTCYKFYNDSKKTGHVKKNIEELNPVIKKTFDFISTVIWLLSEWNHVAAVVVAVAYWLNVIPDYVNNTPNANDPDSLSFFTFGYHGLQAIFNIIEFFMSNLVFRIWHIFILMLYPTVYLIWIQVIMEARWTDFWPYSVIDYYRVPWFAMIFYVFGLFLVFLVVFIIYWAVSTFRLMVLTKRLKNVRFLWRKSGKMNGIVATSVNQIMNTAIELDNIIDESSNANVTPTYKANTSISTATSMTPPTSPISNFPQSDSAITPPSLTRQIQEINSQEYDEPLAPRGNKKTHEVVNKLIKLRNNGSVDSNTPTGSPTVVVVDNNGDTIINVTTPSPRNI